jgi:hypothetical protein
MRVGHTPVSGVAAHAIGAATNTDATATAFHGGPAAPRDSAAGSPIAARAAAHSFPRMRDTSPEAAEVQIAAFRHLSPAARVAMAFEASDWLLRIARTRPSVPPAPLARVVRSADGPTRAVPDASA